MTPNESHAFNITCDVFGCTANDRLRVEILKNLLSDVDAKHFRDIQLNFISVAYPNHSAC